MRKYYHTQAASLRKATRTLACLCLLFNFQFSIFNSPTASAQHFEWAKGYGSAANDGNSIVGTVADSEGNLYILGDFHPDAEWGDEALLPPAMTPYGPYRDTRSVVVAKISPSGEMLWKKVIHGSNDAWAYDIKMQGDTAIAFMARYNAPVLSQHEYLYYMDTLYTNEEDFVHDLSDMAIKFTTAYIVLDLNGNILEDHALNVTFVDRNGNDVTFEYTNVYGPQAEYENDVLRHPSFDVDQEGNVYICRWAFDRLSEYDLENGDLSAVKFWVDNHVAGVVDIPKGARYWFPQLIKFSPRLDTVLNSRYLVQKGRSGKEFSDCQVRCRTNGDIYVIWNIDNRMDDTIVCDSLRGIEFKLNQQDVEIGYLFAFTSFLNQKWGIFIERDTIMIPGLGVDTPWKDVCFDEDSNLIFLSSKLYVNSVNGDTSNFTAVLSYDGVPLPIQSSSAIVMALRERENDIPELAGIGRFPSIFSAGATGQAKGSITCKNNRIFWQAGAQGGFVFPSGTIEFERSYGESSLGVVIMDYQMNVLEGFCFDSHMGSLVGPVVVYDSILYLTNYLTEGHAQFGDISFQENPTKNYATIAKYVDTAFMTPYVHTGDTGNVRIVLAENDSWIAAYPNPFRQRVVIEMKNEELRMKNGIVSAILTDLTGRREEVRLTPSGHSSNNAITQSSNHIYTLDLSSRPQATYLLTLTTADGRQHTVRLLKQSDMFGN